MAHALRSRSTRSASRFMTDFQRREVRPVIWQQSALDNWIFTGKRNVLLPWPIANILGMPGVGHGMFAYVYPLRQSLITGWCDNPKGDWRVLYRWKRGFRGGPAYWRIPPQPSIHMYPSSTTIRCKFHTPANADARPRRASKSSDDWSRSCTRPLLSGPTKI
jgi:hypothetical protein